MATWSFPKNKYAFLVSSACFSLSSFSLLPASHTLSLKQCLKANRKARPFSASIIVTRKNAASTIYSSRQQRKWWFSVCSAEFANLMIAALFRTEFLMFLCAHSRIHRDVLPPPPPLQLLPSSTSAQTALDFISTDERALVVSNNRAFDALDAVAFESPRTEREQAPFIEIPLTPPSVSYTYAQRHRCRRQRRYRQDANVSSKSASASVTFVFMIEQRRARAFQTIRLFFIIQALNNLIRLFWTHTSLTLTQR